MLSSVEYRNWERDNPRARKVAKRRDRKQRARRSSPQHHLADERPRAKVVGSWEVRRDGPLARLFEELKAKAKEVTTDRRQVDLQSKRGAIKALDECDAVSFKRLSRHGAMIGWSSIEGKSYQVRIREEDCVPCREEPDSKCFDDWQWLLKRNELDQQAALLAIDIYEGITRRQVVTLLDTGSVIIDSGILGSIKVICNAGVLHTQYLPAAEILELDPEPAAQAA